MTQNENCMSRIEYSAIPRSVAVRIGGKVRAANETDHCESCHEDHSLGYFEHEESWRYDEEFMNGRKAHDKRNGKPPWALQFCCCDDAARFDKALTEWLQRTQPREGRNEP